VVHPRPGPRIVNWPRQQLDNGRARNIATSHRYKRFVRALKNCENSLAAAGTIKELPSYFMECLVWNVADANLIAGSLDAGFRATLLDLWSGLNGSAYENWVEPNGIKYLFRASQKWTQTEAIDLILSAWSMLYSE